MSFFPVISTHDCEGFAVLFNYPPNNWQRVVCKQRALGVCWASQGLWHSVKLANLAFGASVRISTSDLVNIVPDGCTPFLFLSDNDPPEVSEALPNRFAPSTVPNWRGCLGLIGKEDISFELLNRASKMDPENSVIQELLSKFVLN